MKLSNDTILIETRSEIDMLQDMIETYLQIKGNELDNWTKTGLKAIKDELDVTYMSW